MGGCSMTKTESCTAGIRVWSLGFGSRDAGLTVHHQELIIFIQYSFSPISASRIREARWAREDTHA